MAKESMFVKNIWKWLVLLIAAVGSAYLVVPPKEKIRLGLDLAGGTRFTLEVDKVRLRNNLIEANPALESNPEMLKNEEAKILQDSEDRIVEIIRRRVDAMGTSEPLIQSIRDDESPRFIVELPGAKKEDSDRARARLSEMSSLEFRLVPKNEGTLLDNLPDGAPVGYQRVEGGFIRAENYADISSASNYLARLAKWGIRDRENQREVKFILQRNEKDPFFVDKDGKKHSKFVARFVERKVRLKGSDLQSAKPTSSDDPLKPGYSISFEVKDSASDQFRRMTGSHIGRQLAIILDGELISSPVINDAIGSSGVITGNFSADEAKNLANDLNAGALPAPLMVAASTEVAATVGSDAINSGIYAAVIGFLLVALFMIFYYWRAGFVANIALLLDVVLLPAALFLVASILGIFVDNMDGAAGAVQLPVLTMPGIAGLVLTLGMAVDANVLIYERIREEFARGATAGKAISAGYGKAFTAIIDSNITTIMTGVILFVVGTGPVRGFAIMLTGGVVISMFTAVVVTRLIFDYTVDPNRTKPFKMLQFFKNPKVDFMAWGNKTLLISAVIIVATLGLFTYRVITKPTSVLAVDLTGGTSIVYDVKEGEVDVGEVRKAIDPFDNAALIQTGDNGKILSIKTGIDKGDTEEQIKKLLDESEALKGLKLEQKSCDVIGPSVGNDLRRSGSKAVLFSLIGILIYIGFRFRFGFALGGVVALAHDALIAFGLFSLCGRQVSLIVITALLTIIGYSINDTVVVFDRIREMLKRDSRTPLKDVCNAAINSCLSRTVITSLTTFFTVAVLFIFTDGSIYDFALTMLFGIVAGTYSSIFIATPVMAWWYRKNRPSFDDEEPKKEVM